MAAMHRPPPCVIDVEASGFGRASYPIEVGYVLPDGRARCTLVRPEATWTHWDAAAEQTHHIDRDTLLAKGRPAAEVAQMLNDDLAGLTVYCDGWAHDYTWLGALFEAAGLRPRFKLETVARLLDEQSLARLPGAQHAALAELGLARHRASSDARALQMALSRLLPDAVLAPEGCPQARAFSRSCSSRHMTLPEPLLGNWSANSTMRGTL